MRQWFLVLAGLILAGSVYGAAQAQQPKRDSGGPPAACRSDVAKLCGDVKPGGGRLMRCLAQHRDKLSKSCSDALADAGAANHRDADAASKKPKVDRYGILEFVMVTGSDDLRGDSVAWAIVRPPHGKSQNCQLKSNGQDSWGNGSTNTVNCELHAQLSLDDLRKTRVVVAYNGFGGGTFETQDNWNLNGVTIKAYNQDHKPICVFQATGNPLHRFQDVHGGFGVTNDSIVVTDFPSNCR